MSIEARETTFAWPRRLKSSWRLAGLIFVMLLLHSAAFFLFQAATPVINPPPRTAPPVQLLTAFTPDGRVSAENQSLLRWIEAEDPALVARIPNVEMPRPPDVHYQPSYKNVLTPRLSVPPEPATVQFPPARDALSVIMSGAPTKEHVEKAVERQPSKITLSANLASRVTEPIRFQPKIRTAKPVEPAVFIVGVSPDGDMRFVFQQQEASESAPTLFAEAEDAIRQLAFKQEPGPGIVWGQAIVDWGDDVAQEP